MNVDLSRAYVALAFIRTLRQVNLARPSDITKIAYIIEDLEDYGYRH